MLSSFVNDKVYYKIFDKSYNFTSHIYSASNLFIDDSPIPQNNIKAVKTFMDLDELLILNQVHGNYVINADYIKDFAMQPQADGSVTSRINVGLAIQTADCLPLLLCCSNTQVIGAAHCGWRSIRDNIISKVLELMKKLGACDIQALIGPCIKQPYYEVNNNYYNIFIEKDLNFKKYFLPSNLPDHYLFDLTGTVKYLLNQGGVENIRDIDKDTYSNENLYPSYRRDYKLNAKFNKNRILSVIALK